jgi:serine protease Do
MNINSSTTTPSGRAGRRRPRRPHQLVSCGSVSGARRRLAGMAGAVLVAGLIGGLGVADAARASTHEASGSASSTPQQRVAALIKPSLVYIAIDVSGEVDVPLTDGTTERLSVTSSSACSGSVIDSSGVILTAGHCADPHGYAVDLIDSAFAQLQKQGLTGDLQAADAEQGWTVPHTPDLSIDVYSAANAVSVGQATPMPANVLFDEPLDQGDVAFLHVDPPNPLPALQLASGNPEPGADVVSAGFPGSVTDTVDLANLQPSFSAGEISGRQTRNGKPFLETSTPMSPGVSGGPTVNLQGQVLGTNSWVPGGETQAFNFAAATSEIQAELRSKGIPVGLDSTDQAWRAGMRDYWAGRYHAAAAHFSTVLVYRPADASANYYRGKAVAAYPLDKHESAGAPVTAIALIALMLLAATGVGVWAFLRPRRRTQAVPVPPSPSRDALPLG